MSLLVIYVWICDDCGEKKQTGVLDAIYHRTVTVPYPSAGWSTWNDGVICDACLVRRTQQLEDE